MTESTGGHHCKKFGFYCEGDEGPFQGSMWSVVIGLWSERDECICSVEGR